MSDTTRQMGEEAQSRVHIHTDAGKLKEAFGRLVGFCRRKCGSFFFGSSKQGVEVVEMSEVIIDRGGPVIISSGGKRVSLKRTDMKHDLLKEAIDIAVAAFENYGVEKDIAEQIKKELDKKYGRTWHCIVGERFGSNVTHLKNHLAIFYLDSKVVLLFKS